MQELMPINVVIGDRSYRIRIDPKDEEVVRKTLKTINDKIIEFKTAFAGKDMQDYVSMVLLWFATEQQKPADSAMANGPIEEKIERLNHMLDKALAAPEFPTV